MIAKQKAEIKRWLAGLCTTDLRVAREAARAALAGPRKRDRYDDPVPKPKDNPLDLVDEDGNDLPPDAA